MRRVGSLRAAMVVLAVVLGVGAPPAAAERHAGLMGDPPIAAESPTAEPKADQTATPEPTLTSPPPVQVAPTALPTRTPPTHPSLPSVGSAGPSQLPPKTPSTSVASQVPAATVTPLSRHLPTERRRAHRRRGAASAAARPSPLRLPAVRLKPAPVVSAAVQPPVAEVHASGPSLGVLIALITALGALAVLLLRVRPEWFTRREPPAAV